MPLNANIGGQSKSNRCKEIKYLTEQARHIHKKVYNIEVEIDITDKSPFCIRPYHIQEEDKKFIDKEIKQLCYLGILKE